MTELAQNKNRNVQPLTLQAALPLIAAANPFLGSGIVRATDGNVTECTSAEAGQPFEGLASRQVETRFAPTVAGGASVVGGGNVEVDRGHFLAELPVSGVAADDIFHRRPVYMTDDATFTMVATNGSYVGNVVGIAASGIAIVCCFSAGFRPALNEGVRSLAPTGAVTITSADADKLILIPSTGAQVVTLPLAADCPGKKLTFKKTTADAVAATLTRAGSDTIDGATTLATIDAQYDTHVLQSDGVATWHVISSKLA